MPKLYQLTISEDFSAGHHLRGYNGKCESPHGHNFSVEITVEGDQLEPKAQFLIDFGVMRRELKAELEALDHKDLNALPPFDRINPSSENLAAFLYQRLKTRFQDTGKGLVRLKSVSVSEKPGQSALYMEFVQDA